MCITVRETGGGAYGGNVSRDYVVQNSSSAGVANKTLTLNAGTYVFDQSGSTNASHPLRISTTNDGTHGGGSAYTTGVTTSGTPGTDGKTTIVINASTPSTLYYYCISHSGMGGTINITTKKGKPGFKKNVNATTGTNGTQNLALSMFEFEVGRL